MAFLREDHPGALMEILTEFAVRGINLVRIESRPTGDGLGRYYFFIDCEGHVDDARVGEALMGLRRVCADVRFLGSYPGMTGAARTSGPGPPMRSSRRRQRGCRDCATAGSDLRDPCGPPACLRPDLLPDLLPGTAPARTRPRPGPARGPERRGRPPAGP